MTEEWRDVAGYEGRYQVSSLGRVKSCQRRVCSLRDHSHCVDFPERIMRQMGHYRGYLIVFLNKEGVKRKFFVHRLVAAAFCEGDPSDVVNHRDGDKHNNAAENLEHATFSENTQHYYDGKKEEAPF